MIIKRGFLKILMFCFVMSIGLSFTFGSLPDLTVTQLQMVNDCYIDVTIRNTGQAGLLASQYSQVILQLRLNGKDWAGGRLTSYASSGELSIPGGTLVIQKLYNKRVPDGTHTVEVVVDPLNFLTESNDGNNSMSVSMTGTCGVPVPGGKPDLNLSNLRLVNNCQVAFTVKNLGDIGVPNHGFTGSAVHLYKNNAIIASKTLGEIDPGKLLKNTGSTVNFTYEPGVSIGTGSSQIKVHLNLNFADKKTSDNTIVKTLNCQSSEKKSRIGGEQGGDLPDLTVTDLKMIASCYVEVAIKNIGSAGLKPDQYFKTILQLRLDGKDWAGGRLTSYAYSGELSTPGGTLVIKKAFNKRVPDGKHDMEAVVDPLNYLSESDNSNNSKSVKVTGNCGIAPPGTPDIKVHDLKLDSNCRVQVTLKSIGTAGIPAGNFSSSNVHLYKNNSIVASRTLSDVDPHKLLKNIGGTVKYTFKHGADIGQGGQIKVLVNPTFKDGNPANNFLIRSLQCGKPDLTIISINEVRLKGKKSKKYRVTVKNIGTRGAPGSILRVSAGLKTKGRDYRVRPLSPGAIQNVTVEVMLTSGGRNVIVFKVDPHNSIKELREDNNLKKKTVTGSR